MSHLPGELESLGILVWMAKTAMTAVGAAAAALAALYVYRRRLRQRPTTPKPREPPSWPKVPLKLSENANELFSVCRLATRSMSASSSSNYLRRRHCASH